LDTSGQLPHEKLVENLKITLPERKLEFEPPNPVISPTVSISMFIINKKE
jgi:hypothetical protein